VCDVGGSLRELLGSNSRAVPERSYGEMFLLAELPFALQD
jgi:hypothetical protein